MAWYGISTFNPHPHPVEIPMSLIIIAVAFIIGVIVGAYSHKWLASEVEKTTGATAAQVANPTAAAEAAVKAKV